METVGGQLRRIRLARGESLDSVGRRAGLSKGYLSRVENGQSSPSIAALARLGEAFGLPMAAFFESGDESTGFSVVRADQRLVVNTDFAEPGYRYESIVHRKADRRVEAFVITLLPTDRSEQMFAHPGEEVFFVLSGAVRFTYGGQVHFLNPGDCACFDATVDHRGDAHGGTPAQALAVFIPPDPVRRSSQGKPSNGRPPPEQEEPNDQEDQPPHGP